LSKQKKKRASRVAETQVRRETTVKVVSDSTEYHRGDSSESRMSMTSMQGTTMTEEDDNEMEFDVGTQSKF